MDCCAAFLEFGRAEAKAAGVGNKLEQHRFALVILEIERIGYRGRVQLLSVSPARASQKAH